MQVLLTVNVELHPFAHGWRNSIICQAEVGSRVKPAHLVQFQIGTVMTFDYKESLIELHFDLGQRFPRKRADLLETWD